MPTDKSQSLNIHLLGCFRVSVGEEDIPSKRFKLHKARSLVKLLALAPKHQLHREQLMEQLWADFEPELAANNLYQAVYAARRALGEQNSQEARFLTYQDERLQLCAEATLWVDVEAFENAAAWARWSKDVTSIQSALSLYTGDLLPEDCYEDWCAPRREKLRQEYVDLLLALAELYAEHCDYSQAIQSYQQVLAAEPEREEAHVALMRLYALSGQRSLAVRQYETLQETLSRELETEPDTASRALYQAILSGSYPSEPPQAPQLLPTEKSIASELRHNLPARLSSFVGREEDIQAVQSALESSRLVTLTGAGGVGKSSLAVQCALQAVADFPDGAWLVELAALSDPQLVTQSVAGIFHLRPDPQGDFLPSLQYYLESRQLLLVLDNCEHLISACASLAETLLKSCPHLHILATSRERLGIPGEQVFYVPSLPFPEFDEKVAVDEYAAVQLFAERARAVQPGFQMNTANAPAVASICRRLDGIPLAIELAAARVPVLSAEQIAARLDSAFQLLTHGARTALPRHQTLRASIEWSYNLLSLEEQALLRRLSVFAGGWTLEAAEVVCAGASDTLDLLDSLVHKSIVSVRSPDKKPRFYLLETTRQYARQKLIEIGEEQVVRQRHLEYYLQLGEAGKHTPPNDWMDRLLLLKPERDNFRAALSWALDETPQENAELGLRLANAFLSGGKRIDPDAPAPATQLEFLDWARKGLARMAENNLPDSAARAEALCWMGGILYNDQGFQLVMQGVDLFRKIPHTDPRDLSWSLGIASLIASIVKAEPRLGRSLSEESLEVLAGVEEPVSWNLAFSLVMNCISAWMNEEFGIAKRDAKKSYLLFMQEMDLIWAASGLRFIATINSAQGDYADARSRFEEALELLQKISPEYQDFISKEIQMVREYIASLDLLTADYLAAQDVYLALLATAENLGDVKGIGYSSVSLAKTNLALGNPRKAIYYLQKTMSVARIVQSGNLFAQALTMFAGIFVQSGVVRSAAVCLGAAESRKMGFFNHTRGHYNRLIETTKSALGEGAFAAAFAEGQAMTLEQAADLALEALKSIESTDQDESSP